MKNFIAITATVLLISTVSCRQEDEIMSQESVNEMKIIQNNKSDNFQLPNKKEEVQNDIPPLQNCEEDGEIQPPPRK